MSGRIDYFDDPSAPKANSLVPSVNVLTVNDAGEILLIRRSDNGNWALPGGAVELGESLPDAAVRETFEETGVRVELTGIVGTFTDPRHVMLYNSNGEARQEFSIVVMARPVGGEPAASDESSDARWVTPSDLAGLVMDRSMRQRISHYLTGGGKPHLG